MATTKKPEISDQQEIKQEEKEIKREYFVFVPLLIIVFIIIAFAATRPQTKSVAELVNTTDGAGYWIVYENGKVDAFGSAENVEAAALAEGTYIVAAQPAANGFWATTNKGNILTFAGAQYAGALDAIYSDAGVAELIGDPQKRGYRIASNDGPVYPFNLDQVGGVNNIKQPAAAASTQTGDGFWLVSSSGYVTSFGGASNLNSIEVGDRRVVDAATYSDGMVVLINDGSVNVLGSGENFGDLKQESLKSPLIDIDPTADELGYRITAKDGTVYVFGSAKEL